MMTIPTRIFPRQTPFAKATPVDHLKYQSGYQIGRSDARMERRAGQHRHMAVRAASFRTFGWIEICTALFVASIFWLLFFLPARAQAASSDTLSTDAQIFVPMAFGEAGTGQPIMPSQEESPVPAPVTSPQAECELNAREAAVAEMMAGHSAQKRARLVCDPILAKVARERAADMATRGYFSHVNPSGYGPNYLVTQAGYTLPDWYSKANDGNNIESIGAGYTSPSAVWDGWLNSSGHRRHVLAEENGNRVEFYAEQEAYGIGYWEDPDSPFKHYWVVLTAPISE